MMAGAAYNDEYSFTPVHSEKLGAMDMTEDSVYAVSDDGLAVARAVENDHLIQVYQFQSHTVTLLPHVTNDYNRTGHDWRITAISWSTPGSFLAVAFYDKLSNTAWISLYHFHFGYQLSLVEDAIISLTHPPRDWEIGSNKSSAEFISAMSWCNAPAEPNVLALALSTGGVQVWSMVQQYQDPDTRPRSAPRLLKSLFLPPANRYKYVCQLSWQLDKALVVTVREGQAAGLGRLWFHSFEEPQHPAPTLLQGSRPIGSRVDRIQFNCDFSRLLSLDQESGAMYVWNGLYDLHPQCIIDTSANAHQYQLCRDHKSKVCQWHPSRPDILYVGDCGVSVCRLEPTQKTKRTVVTDNMSENDGYTVSRPIDHVLMERQEQPHLGGAPIKYLHVKNTVLPLSPPSSPPPTRRDRPACMVTAITADADGLTRSQFVS